VVGSATGRQPESKVDSRRKIPIATTPGNRVGKKEEEKEGMKEQFELHGGCAPERQRDWLKAEFVSRGSFQRGPCNNQGDIKRSRIN
jgi:hypothetical protein